MEPIQPCAFCENPIPQERFRGQRSSLVRYCSTRCRKKARYSREHPNRIPYYLKPVKPTVPIDECAYAAALLDGEGCITVSRRRHTRKWQNFGYDLQCDIGNTYLPMTRWLQNRWGGSIRRQQQTSHNDGWPAAARQPLDVWRASGAELFRFLRDVLPWLQRTRALAVNALVFAELRKDSYGHRWSPEELETAAGLFVDHVRLSPRRGRLTARAIGP
jgi:hypothetical protein